MSYKETRERDLHDCHVTHTYEAYYKEKKNAPMCFEWAKCVSVQPLLYFEEG